MARKPTTFIQIPSIVPSRCHYSNVHRSAAYECVFSQYNLPVPGPRRTDPAHLDQGLADFSVKGQTANTSGFTGYPVSAQDSK